LEFSSSPVVVAVAVLVMMALPVLVEVVVEQFII
tara:strand:- start:327 stop:428 length:102 start_codon:yes stop_codon:yes gene_type:complete